ncbi:MFS transporter [Agrococcus versicolor]|uniref:MFS transporter n=1 Tax=Agrococcus versicolor TaxID=501482 RepID=A0ABP5M9S9_9MICO
MRQSALLWVSLGTVTTLAIYVVPLATILATSQDLDADAGAQAWILSAMSIGLAAALLAAGALGDAHGTRRVYAAGLVTLGAGAAACAAAQEGIVLVVGRIVQGVGGAAVLACGLAILAQAYPGAARTRAMAWWGASVSIGIAAGALLTAFVDVDGGWRISHVVTGVLALALVVPSMRSFPDPRSARSGARIGLPGVALLVVAMAGIVATMTQARERVDATAVALGAISLAALVGLVLVERRSGSPLVGPELMRSPRFLAATVGSFAVGIGITGMASFAPVMAQAALGADLRGAAVPVLAWTGVSIVAALVLGRLPWSLGGSMPIGVLLVGVAAAQALAIGVDGGSSLWRLTLPFAIAGLATGALNGLLGREAVASVPADRAATGSGASSTARYLGAAIGITLFVTIATHVGDDVGEGWAVASAVSASLTAGGGALVLILGWIGTRTAVPSR